MECYESKLKCTYSRKLWGTGVNGSAGCTCKSDSTKDERVTDVEGAFGSSVYCILFPFAHGRNCLDIVGTAALAISFESRLTRSALSSRSQSRVLAPSQSQALRSKILNGRPSYSHSHLSWPIHIAHHHPKKKK